jgi:hypothetical protein
MIEIEKTVVKLAVIREMLKTVHTPIEEAEAKVRTWLKSMSKPDATIEDTLHVYLQISEEKKTPGPDSDAVAAEFSSLVKAGKYTQTELQDLVKTGQLAFVDPSQQLAAVQRKISGYVAPTKTVVTAATDPDKAPLKILAKANARFDGLRTLVRATGDLRPTVQRILEAPLDTAGLTKVPTPGLVALGAAAKTRKK